MLAVLVAGVVLCVSAGMVTAAGAFGANRRAAWAADAAALAAADVVSGRLAGASCDVADRVARVNGARLEYCRVDGLVATVTASVGYLGLSAIAGARGPARIASGRVNRCRSVEDDFQKAVLDGAPAGGERIV